MTIRSHTFATSGEAYDSSQTVVEIHDGDVLLVPSEGRAAVVVGAWPVYAFGDDNAGPAFHTLQPGINWLTLDDGKYYNAAIVALSLHVVNLRRGAGLPVDESLLKMARAHGWSDQ